MKLWNEYQPIMDESYPIVKGDMLKTNIETTTYTLEDERLEPTNHPFGKENDLNQTSMRTCSMILFRGVVDPNEAIHDSNDQLEINLPGSHFTG